MSYDVSLEVPSGPASYVDAFWVNHTSNTSQMWRDAGCDLAAFDQKPATSLLPALGAGIADMLARPEHHRQYEPDNKWGSYESTLRFLREIEAACIAHPYAIVRVDH